MQVDGQPDEIEEIDGHPNSEFSDLIGYRMLYRHLFQLVQPAPYGSAKPISCGKTLDQDDEHPPRSNHPALTDKC